MDRNVLTILFIFVIIFCVEHATTQSSTQYYFSRFSCTDFIPKHLKEIQKLREEEQAEMKRIIAQREKGQQATKEKLESEETSESATEIPATRRRKREISKNFEDDEEFFRSIRIRRDNEKAIEFGSGNYGVPRHSVEDSTNGETHSDQATDIPELLEEKTEENSFRAMEQAGLESAAQQVETTTRSTTTTTTMPPKAVRGTGSNPITILTSEDKYRRLKIMKSK